MESERPTGYEEYISGDQSWGSVGMRIATVEPGVPGESAHNILAPITSTVSVECKSHISHSDVTASLYTCLVHQDNEMGIYREIPMTYIEDCHRRLGDDVIVYKYKTTIYPTSPGYFRLTYNVKLGQKLVWANNFRKDHILSIFGGKSKVDQVTRTSVTKTSETKTSETKTSVTRKSVKTTTVSRPRQSVEQPVIGDDMINALALQRAGVPATVAYQADIWKDCPTVDPKCQDIVKQISSLDDLINNLSHEFSLRSAHLVNTAGGKGPSDCLPSIKSSWQWVVRSMQCAEIHLRNAASYHEFFQSAAETEEKLNSSLSNINLSLENKDEKEKMSESERMASQIKQVLNNYQQWQTKLNQLYNMATEVVPVPERIGPIKEARPVRSLVDFSSDQVKCIEGETMMLVENEDEKLWKVRTNTGGEGEIPAVLVLIPPPYKPALELVIKLKLQFLTLWMNSLKRLGFQMIATMVHLLRDWSDEDVYKFQALSDSDKEKLIYTLCHIESELVKNWSGYGDFEELGDRIMRLVMILENTSEVKSKSFSSKEIGEFVMNVVTPLLRFEDMLKIYLLFWKEWEMFLNIIELMKHPEFMLVCDKWEQLKYLKSSEFIRFWETSTGIVEEDITKSKESHVLAQAPTKDKDDNKRRRSYQVTIEDTTEEATTDTVTSITEEQLQTYIIKTIIDPTDGKTPISLQKAIMLGIIDQVKRTYVNPWTGVTMSFSDAINSGFIIIEILKWEKIKEEKKSYGLITIKTTTEEHPYKITHAVDPDTQDKVSMEEAINKKIVNMEKQVYKTKTGDMIDFAEAIKLGFLSTKDVPVTAATGSQEVDEETYAVYGVVDQKKKNKVSFTEAVKSNLLDKETGDYINNETGERTGVVEAIQRGFIKARLVDDPTKLELDPENTILVEKAKKAAYKVMAQMKVLHAFKSFKFGK